MYKVVKLFSFSCIEILYLFAYISESFLKESCMSQDGKNILYVFNNIVSCQDGFRNSYDVLK